MDVADAVGVVELELEIAELVPDTLLVLLLVADEVLVDELVPDTLLVLLLVADEVLVDEIGIGSSVTIIM